MPIGRKLISSAPPLTIDREENGGGFRQLKRKVRNYQNMASFGYPVLLIADLDSAECPESLRSTWLEAKPNECFLFRVAVREIEAWLLADRLAIADFLKINRKKVPDAPERLTDPKATLLRLARGASRKIQEGLSQNPNLRSADFTDYAD